MKRTIALLLVVVMIVSLAPNLVAYAAEGMDGNWVTLDIYDDYGKIIGERAVRLPDDVPAKEYYANLNQNNHEYELAREMIAKLPNGANYVKAYDALVNCISNVGSYVDVRDCNIGRQGCDLVTSAVYADYPEYFWYNGGYSRSCDYSQQKDYDYGSDYPLIYIYPQYYATGETLDEMRAEFDEEVDKALSYVTDFMTDYEKELYIHDYLIGLVTYALNNDYHQSAYGALVKKSCVCAGYSRAMQCLLKKVGIKAMFVTGVGITANGSESHAWNLVKLDDTFVWMDSTWDDQVYSMAQHDYFNLDTTTFSPSHVMDSYNSSSRWFYQYIPECTSLEYTYDNMLDMDIDMQNINLEDVARLVNSPRIDVLGVMSYFNVVNGTSSEFMSWFDSNRTMILEAAGQNESTSTSRGSTESLAYYAFYSPSGTGTLYGNLVSNYYSSEPVTLTLKNSSDEVVFEYSYADINITYAIYGLTPGEYTLTASKAGNVERKYDVTVTSGSSTVQDVALNLISDIDGDRHLTNRDIILLQRHCTGLSSIDDDYALRCADSYKDNKINNRDISFALRLLLDKERIA